MELTCRVPGKSSFELECEALDFLEKYEPSFLNGTNGFLDVERALDDCYMETGVCLQLVSDESIPNEIASFTSIENRTINLRYKDYWKLNSDGYTRMTAMHEVGHAKLHLPYLCKSDKLCRENSAVVPAYASAEWQARVWASFTLMPFPRVMKIIAEMQNCSWEDIVARMCQEFRVSWTAADVRLKTIKKYKEKNIFNRLMREMARRDL